MFAFLLVVHAIIAAALVTVILMQRSEGGGLTTGGSPSGLMSARGAANFLTRATSVLAGLFIAMAIVLAVYASTRQGAATVDASLARSPGAPITRPQAPAPGADASTLQNAAAAAAAGAAPVPGDNSTVPLAR
jgi:preprotein translocase subunit SecG